LDPAFLLPFRVSACFCFRFVAGHACSSTSFVEACFLNRRFAALRAVAAGACDLTLQCCFAAWLKHA
jgi:hypothetical protein